MTVQFEKGSAANADVSAVAALYADLIRAWNEQDAAAFAIGFARDGIVIGFDGSEQIGSSAIEDEMSKIFADHETATYVAKVRGVELLASDVALLRAAAGMVPPGKTDLNPERHAQQTVVARKKSDRWEIALFQNTPAQFHGRPELVEEWTEELRHAMNDAPTAV